VGPVNSLGEALTDPQVVHNQLISTLPAGSDGPAVPTVGLPMRFDGERPDVRRTAPALGQHTEEILTWLKESR
jgi:crotonobetainyl-CoA:carnitine CoA-transferase CaiB-like acyl-CoA transferase